MSPQPRRGDWLADHQKGGVYESKFNANRELRSQHGHEIRPRFGTGALRSDGRRVIGAPPKK